MQGNLALWKNVPTCPGTSNTAVDRYPGPKCYQKMLQSSITLEVPGIGITTLFTEFEKQAQKQSVQKHNLISQINSGSLDFVKKVTQRLGVVG